MNNDIIILHCSMFAMYIIIVCVALTCIVCIPRFLFVHFRNSCAFYKQEAIP